LIKIKISLIITVYNRVNLFRKSLISLLNQSQVPDELIISDDGSDEDVLSGISDIVKELPFPTKYIKQQHKGFRLAKCRNNGVKISSGGFLIFLDQDIIHTKNFIKTFVENKKVKRFVTSYPVRLSDEQSTRISEHVIRNYEFVDLVSPKQINKIKKQYIRDYVSFIGKKIGVVKQKPKLRGGVCAINRDDYYLVNGYDEMFKGWGNEDDDIRKRLYKAGVTGFNPFYNEYPLHLYHEPFHDNGKRINQPYIESRKKEIKSGSYKCEFGIGNSAHNEEVEVIEL
jgi:glycosyltransferase involved in cell wall biosynthesis